MLSGPVISELLFLHGKRRALALIFFGEDGRPNGGFHDQHKDRLSAKAARREGPSFKYKPRYKHENTNTSYNREIF
jgi:hypothetical protein